MAQPNLALADQLDRSMGGHFGGTSFVVYSGALQECSSLFRGGRPNGTEWGRVSQ